MTVSEAFIRIDNLSKSFDPALPPALDHVTAAFSSGQMIGLVGPDGAGKTTLIRLMAGLLKPTSGRILIDQIDVMENSEAVRQFIGYMPQQFGLYEDLSVAQNLNLYADLQGLDTHERSVKFEKLLKFSGLSPFKERLAGDLSGGMKQKLGLICALMRAPALLLLDEPSVGVDPISRRELWKMMQELLAEGITVVWSTSYLDEAEKCDQVLLLNEGQLLFCGKPSELTSRLVNRTFLIQNIAMDRRKLLQRMIGNPEIIDLTIQGDAVRVVLKKGGVLPDLKHWDAGPEACFKAAQPRFEDAFIDILGGRLSDDALFEKQIRPVEEAREIMVEADDLTKKFGDFTAVNGISFSIKKGEIFGLLGPNGAGKSTTFKMLCGLVNPTSGISYVRGVPLQQAPSAGRAQIGYMAQKFSLYRTMTVLQNLTFFSGIYSVPSGERSETIQAMIQIFEFERYIHLPSGELPLGFQRRLSLACALMHQPPILFLDEPTSGVDPVTRREFWNHINLLVSKGVTVLVTTHFMDEAEYCDRIGLVSGGRLITVGTPDALKAQASSADNPHPSMEDAFIILSAEQEAGR